VIYTAASAALAVLEILVHREPDSVPPSYVLFSCSFDEGLVTELLATQLPDTWKALPAPPELRKLGDDWVRQARSAVLRVPSVVIPTEWNCLLNPEHADFHSIVIGEPSPFDLDQRLR
jgi:RES domain-containing protein